MSFERYNIEQPENAFSLLHQSVCWEEFSKGRRIAIIARSNNDDIPLVRTTTAYQTPSQSFSAIHETIVDKIRHASGIIQLELNHAMMEVYDSRYKTMKFHSDQALDLDPNSYICLFSCYENGGDSHPRVLTIQNKEDKKEFEVVLLHHSVVIFSTTTNQKHLHKIEAKDLPKNHDNRWMGLTLRLSKSFVRFTNGVPHLISGKSDLGELTIATDKERQDFFGCKGAENREIEFEYPELRYTISPSDRIPFASSST